MKQQVLTHEPRQMRSVIKKHLRYYGTMRRLRKIFRGTTQDGNTAISIKYHEQRTKD